MLGERSPRYLTENLGGIGGVIKAQPQDFRVEEMPLYPPDGQGEHTFFEIEKVGLSTFGAVRNIAKALGVSQRSVGYAGLKDARAITCQVMSVHGVAPDQVMALDLPNIEIHWARRHRTKLKIGHLQGNRFTIRIRDVEEGALATCNSILEVLVKRGVPNYFGPQRFGLRGDSARLGLAVVEKNAGGFVRGFLGNPQSGESDLVQEARTCFDHGQWQQALRLLPGNMADERRVLQVMVRTKGDHERAYRAVPKSLKVFFVSALQSALFNQVLDARLETLDSLQMGDLAMKHPGRSVFYVEDVDREQPRAARFEISPTGPLFGYKMIQPKGSQGEIESRVLDSSGLTLEHFRVGGGIQAKGARRSLRFRVHEPELWFDDGVVIQFWLDRGCYATTLLAEIVKTPLTEM
jgi:tRNA pseudouridine13 synthase